MSVKIPFEIMNDGKLSDTQHFDVSFSVNAERIYRAIRRKEIEANARGEDLSHCLEWLRHLEEDDL